MFRHEYQENGGCVGRLGGANTRPLRVMPLSPVMLVTLADSESTSVASSFIPSGGVYSTELRDCSCKEAE